MSKTTPFCEKCGALEPYWNAAKAFDQQDEIERLRAALRPLLDHYLNCYDGIEDQIAKDAMTALGVIEQSAVRGGE